MTERRSLTIAITIVGVVFVMAAALAVLLWLNHAAGWQAMPGESKDVFKFTDLIQGLPSAGMGALIVWKRPSNRLGWFSAASGIAYLTFDVTYQYAVYTLIVSPGFLPAGQFMAWLHSWIWMLVPTSLPLIFLLFPDGEPPSYRWRPAVWAALVVYCVLPCSAALMPSPSGNPAAISNPYALSGTAGHVMTGINIVTFPLVVALALAGGISLVWRFYHSFGEERLQIKWVVFIASIAVIFFAGSQIVRLPGIRDHVAIPSTASSVALAILEVGIVSCVSVAILKYHLYDIDLIINRTIVYLVLSAGLVLSYTGCVLLLQNLFSPITQRSDLAIALSTLAVAGLFHPARSRIQNAVDRRFYRQKYDAEHALERFEARARQEVDLEELVGALANVIAETVQPVTVSVWLRTAETR